MRGDFSLRGAAPSLYWRWIQLQVSASPASRLVSGRQPSSAAARPGSSTLRIRSPGRAGCVLRRPVEVGDATACVVERRDRQLGPRADVEDAAVAAGGGQHGAHHVADVDEVAGLRAVAEDRARGARRHLLEEDRDHPALETGRLVRPVDVGEAERNVRRAVEAVPGREVLLRGELGRAVRRQGPSRRVLVGGRVALAVDRAAGGAEHDLRPVPARRLDDAEGPEHVDLRVVDRLCNRGADVRLRGEVEADLGACLVEDQVEVVVPADVAHVQSHPVRHEFALAGGEIVEHVHLVAARRERRGDVRADETRTAGDYCPHQAVS